MRLRPFILALAALCLLPPPAIAKKRPPTSLSELSGSLQALAARVGPSVVQVFTTGYAPVWGGYLVTATALGTEETSGSGVILDPDGYIVTNTSCCARMSNGSSRWK